MHPKVKDYGFDHTLCEVCWFARNPARFPVQLTRELGDNICDLCCLCGSVKLTRIWVRLDLDVETLVCEPHAHEDD